jgi:outer membrane protein OmpA-like peptidoglycan-associated protein
MPHAHPSPRPSSITLALAPAFIISLISAGTAFAQADSHTLQSLQSLPSVRVTRDKVEIHSMRRMPEVRMTATKGTVLEVFFIEGDRYQHRDSNWYWVLLPTDRLGNQPVGWIRGDDVELVPTPKPAALAGARPAATLETRSARNDSRASTIATASASVDAPEPRIVEEAPAVRPFVSDVVLNFGFNRSDLTDDAKQTLTRAIAKPTAQARYLAVALEGHADWTGSENYNEQLGLARAETVRQYLAEQLRIPVDQISVVSYGETSPVAPNTTREGRARNRRVVIKAGA